VDLVTIAIIRRLKMKRLWLLLALVALGSSTRSDAAQQLTQAPRWFPLRASELAAIAGSETEAAAVVSQAVAHFVAQSPRPRTVTLAASQIREPWLPAIPGVRFVRFEDEAMKVHYNQCGHVMWLTIDRSGENLVVIVREGTKCRGGGREFLFRREAGTWQIDIGGISGGFGGGTGHCGCS